MRKETIEALRQEFPGKAIICIPDEDNPTEVIVELSQTEIKSVAIVIIDSSAQHFHREICELYEVESGELIVYVDEAEFMLDEGKKIYIPNNHVHWAEGDETRVRVTASPPWTSEDHILVDPS